MHSSLALVFGLLATSISAIPTGSIDTRQNHEVVFQLSNDKSGANGSKPIALDHEPKGVIELFKDTPVFVDGTVYATSAQLTKIVAGAHCTIQKDSHVIAEVNDRATYADLDGNPKQAIPVNLGGAFISCWKA
ncbi:hypothetical protein AJ79_02348 [Helicocarpus griseus UAMH5409]|uniref:Uncharacterized protein n=1 Tax=Helicocarpus griseus UAMH5409 TaxID=1447875 RepID=A0A2B7Y262_9EURO|nr:hypothetical protein AJ79_02348 [Helicocarpus griseus UAMH5409]